MLKRLESTKSVFKSNDWMEHQQIQTQRLKNTCRHPYILARSSTARGKVRKIQRLTTSKLAHKQGIQIGGIHFIAKVIKAGESLKIKVQELEAPNEYKLSLPYESVRHVVEGSNYGYQNLLGLLKFEKGKLVVFEQSGQD